MSKTKVLITGITGMVGSHLADFLLKNTIWEIHGMCRWRSPLDNVEQLIPLANKKKRVFFHYGDLLDFSSIWKVVKKIQPDYVFHLAAQSYPLTSFTSSINTLDTNILGTERLLEAIRSVKEIKPIIHVCSSSEIFGKVKKIDLPIKEDNSFHPASPYAISKVGTDLIAKYHYEAYNQKILITRMFTHTGPRRGDVFAESSFAKQIAMIETGLQENKIFVGNLNSLRTFADVRDAVRAYYLLVSKKPSFGETYNIGGDFTCTIGDMLNCLLSMSSKKDIKIIIDKNRLRPIDADLQIPDTSKFRNKTGWKPQISFKKTMLDLLDFWREKIKKNPNQLIR